MKVFTCFNHATHNPIGGGSSVVVADNEEAARELLDAALRERGIDPSYVSERDKYTLEEVDLNIAHAVVLNDGSHV